MASRWAVSCPSRKLLTCVKSENARAAAAHVFLSGGRCRAHPTPATVAQGDVMTEYEFTVVIERDEDGRYLGVCPGLQGCYTEGETEAEARSLIVDAIRLHIEDRIASGEPICHEVAATKVRVAL